MNSIICDKCHSKKVECHELQFLFYYSVRVKCLECGSSYEVPQRWIRPGVWKQKGRHHITCYLPMVPQEIEFVLDYSPEYVGENGGENK